MEREQKQRAMARACYAIITGFTRASMKARLPVISTGRPFGFYRRVFFERAKPAALLDELQGQRIVDLGCGLTPYTEDSMFQACEAAGVEFYGVDPKLEGGLAFGRWDRMKIEALGGSGLDPNAPGQERMLGRYADDLPFEEESVDRILSGWLFFVWLRDQAILARVFEEALRVLKPGGCMQLYPTKYWGDHRFEEPALCAALAQFEVSQSFDGSAYIWNLPPAYTTTLRKI